VPFDDADKERIRYHLGYLEVSVAASISFGIPRPLQTVFLVEQAMNNVIPAAIPRVMRYLKVLDDIEDKMVDAQDRLAATQLEDLHLREDETDKLEREYVRWASRLSDILGAPIYAYSQRFREFLMGTNAGSIPVR